MQDLNAGGAKPNKAKRCGPLGIRQHVNIDGWMLIWMLTYLIFNNRQPPYGHFRTVPMWTFNADIHDIPASASFYLVEKLETFTAGDLQDISVEGGDGESPRS